MLLVLLLALAAQPPALDVTVRSADGPVAGALVVIDGVESRSDALGKVTVRVVPPTTLTVQADGFLPAAVSLVAPLPSRLEVMLEAVPDIQEEVVADATRTATRLADQPLRVEVIDGEEIEEKALMTPGSIAMLLAETTGLRVQTTAPSPVAASMRRSDSSMRATAEISPELTAPASGARVCRSCRATADPALHARECIVHCCADAM